MKIGLRFVSVLLLVCGVVMPQNVRSDELVANNFEDGTSQDWTLSGNAVLYQYLGSGTDYSYSTPYAVNVPSKSGGSDATLTTPLAVASKGYTNVTWSCYVNADGASGFNQYYFEYSNDGGGTWSTLKSGAVAYLSTGFHSYSVSDADLSDDLIFRFRMTSNSPAKNIYLDNMVITAQPDAAPAGTAIVIR